MDFTHLGANCLFVVFSQTYAVSSYLVNVQQRLSLVSLLLLLQDTAWLHATAQGHGYEAMLRDGRAWVLTRQFVSVQGPWPAWGEEVTVRTWLRPTQGMIANRDFEIWQGERRLATACSGWMTFDLKTRRSVPFELPEQIFRREGWLERTPAKILAQPDAETLAHFRVRNSDLDLNGHVNNVRYAQWIVDSVPWSATRTQRVTDYEVNFLAETRPDDEVDIQRGSDGHFQGLHSGDGRVLFTARLQTEPSC